MPQKSILLVEDNPDDEALTIRALSKHNVVNGVVVARDGVEALDYLFATGAHAGRDVRDLPQIVLLDLKLPKLDGFAVLRRIRADHRTQTLPVVILTSSKEERDVAQGYRDGCNSYVRKPVNFDEFVDAARQLGLYWLLLNEGPPR
jgi:two-component system response regulator